MRNFFIFISVASMGIVLVGCSKQEPRSKTSSAISQASSPEPKASPASPKAGMNSMDHNSAGPHVPAFQTDVASLNGLRPTLSPEKFSGKQRAAYQAVKAIPKTIAQLPCYCYCDEGHGHKSLHSCYEDDHAAQCAVCVDEALLAYRLEKVEKLKPEQIRERIIAQYSSQQ